MARKLTAKEQIIEDLTICPGTGATKSVVSDCYPCWWLKSCQTTFMESTMLGLTLMKTIFGKADMKSYA